ncbi:MAG: IS66 family transposase [Hyphomicrobium sp.]|uniref:IS66 family transposase n=1 Tax=Hyphomicrobium sp. TaxID=82 RepID=UPI0013282337|nr:IS66 family transposase [Hyphomicrobium sp.]KAB2938020.1 MAG: IS66 family transposase [Hyphomicrobium sp.]MBZ0211038.1 IS66 family transposase [Hyphomicrobium sp.]
MTLDPTRLPDDIATLKALLIAEHAARVASDDRAQAAEARALDLDAEIANLKLTIAKMRRETFGTSSERSIKLLDQLELQLAELVEKMAEEKAAAEIAAPVVSPSSTSHKPARRPLPEHLPRERLVHPAPMVCPCCSGTRFRKLGEDTTETLERVPARWKVIVHVRERLACRTCDTIAQTPAPVHPITRGRAGPHLLADVLFGKFGAHLPLNRQSDIYANEGVDLDISTLADWVGASAATLMPLRDAIEKHVLATERIHADDTTVPVLAKGKCTTGRLWAYVRDDAPFGGAAAPAAFYHYSHNRDGAHPEKHLSAYTGLLQADAYAGFNGLYVTGRKPGPIVEAACWAHGRRKFFDLAELQKAPIAMEAVRRIDALFAIEREINGQPPGDRLAVRGERSKPLVDDLERWLREERKKLSSKNPLAKAMDYSLKRWPAFTRFLDDGRICMSNNAAERAVRGIAVGRRNWTFCGSDAGGQRAAVIYTLIETCKLNHIDPRAWLADVLGRIATHPANRIAALLPWNWNGPLCAHINAA